MAKYSGEEILATDIVAQAIEAAARSVAQDAYEEFKHETITRLAQENAEGELGQLLTFDSPLEAVYWVWWMAARQYDYFAELSLSMRRQVKVVASGQNYVLDFVLVPARDTGPADEFIATHFPKIAIELDGHTFHEKTLEQVTYRNARDRNLQRDGWHVFHYSFAEVMERGSGAVIEPIDFARDAYWRLLRIFGEQRRKAQ